MPRAKSIRNSCPPESDSLTQLAQTCTICPFPCHLVKKEADISMLSMEGLTSFEQIAIWAILGIAILGLLYAVYLRSHILKEDKGTEKMQEVWNAIRDGAETYLRSQLRTILPLIALLTFALFFSVYIVEPTPEALERFQGMGRENVRLIIGLGRA
ncbi:MAG TPA: hypothetical protein ENL35_12275, partial [Chloroflexi bacterium]|nr:hypothetical protein [Chloroflexota bacterium]